MASISQRRARYHPTHGEEARDSRSVGTRVKPPLRRIPSVPHAALGLVARHDHPADGPERQAGQRHMRPGEAQADGLIQSEDQAGPLTRSWPFKQLNAPIGHKPCNGVNHVQCDRNPWAYEGERNSNDVEG